MIVYRIWERTAVHIYNYDQFRPLEAYAGTVNNDPQNKKESDFVKESFSSEDEAQRYINRHFIHPENYQVVPFELKEVGT